MSDRPMTPLRRRLIDEMTLRGYAERSIHSYVQAVRQLSKFHGRSPDRLTDDQVRAYLVHLTTVKRAPPAPRFLLPSVTSSPASSEAASRQR